MAERITICDRVFLQVDPRSRRPQGESTPTAVLRGGATGDKDRPLYDIGQATERVAATAEAARALPFPFTLTARTGSFLRGNPNLDDVIMRLQAFEKVGADVLMAPGLPDLATVGGVLGGLEAGQLHGRHQG